MLADESAQKASWLLPFHISRACMKSFQQPLTSAVKMTDDDSVSLELTSVFMVADGYE